MSIDTYRPKNGPAPSDKEAVRAWTEIMKIAQKHALIVYAYGGVAMLMTPDNQRENGRRNIVLRGELYELEPESSKET